MMMIDLICPKCGGEMTLRERVVQLSKFFSTTAICKHCKCGFVQRLTDDEEKVLEDEMAARYAKKGVEES